MLNKHFDERDKPVASNCRCFLESSYHLLAMKKPLESGPWRVLELGVWNRQDLRYFHPRTARAWLQDLGAVALGFIQFAGF